MSVKVTMDHPVSHTLRLSYGCEVGGLFVELRQKVLNPVYFAFIEVRFATLTAYPRGYRIEREMVSLAINVERRGGPFHFSLAMDALHRALLTLKLSSHSSRLGTYAVMMAKYLSFGAQTT